MKYASMIAMLALSLLSSEVVAKATPSETCLALNMYHEARGEGNRGMVAVALVTLNRVKSPKYPKTICKVVYQKRQFSWTSSRVKVKDWKKYNEVLALAKNVLRGKVHHDITKGSLYYHANYVKPHWSHKFQRVAKIGNHIFYREGA